MLKSEFLVIGRNSCPYCIKAKQVIEDDLQVNYTYVDQGDVDPEDRKALEGIAGKEFQTVPQIFKYTLGGIYYIGGFTDLEIWKAEQLETSS